MINPFPQLAGKLDRAITSRLDALFAGLRGDLQAARAEVQAVRAELQATRAELSAQLQETRAVVARNQLLLGSARDQIPELRRRLAEVRASPAYEALWTETEPLVTVRIATWNRAALLAERALPSVLRQTYSRFEVIVVGDADTDDTAARIAKLGDARIRYFNQPFRGIYPDDRRHRWMVAGAPGMNLAARLATGSWIAPLDSDDEFTPDHLEKLVTLALRERAEMAYGKLVSRHRGVESSIYSWPPAYGAFGFQGAIYTKLLGFMEYDDKSWLLEEVADWTLCRRMIEAGVRMASTPEVVGVLFPSMVQAG